MHLKTLCYICTQLCTRNLYYQMTTYLLSQQIDNFPINAFFRKHRISNDYVDNNTTGP